LFVRARTIGAQLLFGGDRQAGRFLPEAAVRLAFGKQRRGGLDRLTAHRVGLRLERRGELEVGQAGGADFAWSGLSLCGCLFRGTRHRDRGGREEGRLGLIRMSSSDLLFVWNFADPIQRGAVIGRGVSP
jgi:hypothetical protein